MFSLFCEYIHLECVHVHVVYRVNQAEYMIHILVVAPHEYVNTYSTPRVWRDGLSQRTNSYENSSNATTYCCEQQAAYDAPRSTHISRYMRRWSPVPLITADIFRRVVLSPVMRPRGRGFDSRSVTFPPPGSDTYHPMLLLIK